jgi:hypothetical protein
MDEATGFLIEIVAHILYLIRLEADDPERVRQLTELARPAVDELLRRAAPASVTDHDLS